MAVLQTVIDQIRQQKERVSDWLGSLELGQDLPLYASVDIRHSLFKLSGVDTNLFPAGFNNLCELDQQHISATFKKEIQTRLPACRRLLIVCENHTRNLWYLENVRVLAAILRDATFEVSVATTLPDGVEDVCLDTATNHVLEIKNITVALDNRSEAIDLIILNNDLTGGIPASLEGVSLPIYPALAAGWHSRQKSHHFLAVKRYMSSFSALVGIDPWFLSCLYKTVSGEGIQDSDHRQQLADKASDLLAEIRQKYHEYGIQEKPYIVLKSDSGTYGMGVQIIHDPSDILALNRKKRNNLAVGKDGYHIRSFLLQEGVPTQRLIEDAAAEACVYHVGKTCIGGFYRLNNKKSDRDNLNSKGMTFSRMCFNHDPHDHPETHQPPDPYWDIYQLITRLAVIAASKETYS